MKKNEVYEVVVTDMNNMGFGIAHIDGMAVFVDGGVTGDRLNIRIIKTASSYAVARIEEVLSASDKREQDPCPLRRCGGCTLGHITRGYELELKKSFVRASFHKQGIEAEVKDVVTDGRRTGYRNKVQMPVEGGKYGYYAKHSHEIIPCGKCLLSSEQFSDVIAFTASYRFPADPQLRHIYIRYGEKTGEMMLTLVTRLDRIKGEEDFVKDVTAAFPMLKSIVVNTNAEDTNVILGKKSRAIYGKDEIIDVLCGCTFAVSSHSFYQVNRNVAELLYEKAIELAAESGPKRVADLYCGAGTIGISFAKKHPGTAVYGLEVVPEAVENAKKNAERNGIKNAEFLCADAETADLCGIDVCIVDPPRKGISEALAEKIVKTGIKRLVYVSCNHETLARDAKYFLSHGYNMGEITPYDMFPRTGSVESVALFVRTESAVSASSEKE